MFRFLAFALELSFSFYLNKFYDFFRSRVTFSISRCSRSFWGLSVIPSWVATSKPWDYYTARLTLFSCGRFIVCDAVALSILIRVDQVKSSERCLPRTWYAVQQKQETYTVGDYMTPVSELYCATVNTTIDEGMERHSFILQSVLHAFLCSKI